MDDPIDVIFEAPVTVEIPFNAILPEDVLFIEQDPIDVEFDDVEDL
jgi:hypothetical protein